MSEAYHTVRSLMMFQERVKNQLGAKRLKKKKSLWNLREFLDCKIINDFTALVLSCYYFEKSGQDKRVNICLECLCYVGLKINKLFNFWFIVIIFFTFEVTIFGFPTQYLSV
ncbi:unnamed protein product [Brassica rapa subsp. trilocularis]